MLRAGIVSLIIVVATIVGLVALEYAVNFFGMGPYKGTRPENVPDHAVYSGNAGIGHWVACERKAGDLYFCRVYYSSGGVLVESNFRLKRASPGGNAEPQKYFFNLTYLETDLGPLIPVGEYLRYTPGHQAERLAYYAGENCKREITALGANDALATLRTFFRRFRKSPEILVRDLKVITYQNKFDEDGFDPEAFVCSGARVRKFTIDGSISAEGTDGFRAYVSFCSNCDYEVDIYE